jgi:hypothetical protein
MGDGKGIPNTIFSAIDMMLASIAKRTKVKEA